MATGKLISIGLSTLLLSACASWIEEDRLAQQRAAQHQWSKMMAQHHNEPAASGPLWQMPNQTAVAYLSRLEQLARQDSEALLKADATVECTLDETSKALLIHQVTPERLARYRAEYANTLQWEDLGNSVTVVAGNCRQGRLDGAFSAVFSDRTRTRSQHLNTDSTVRGRIDGHFRNGQLDGEVRTIKLDTRNTNGQRVILEYYGLGVYESGEQVGTHVMLSRSRSSAGDGDSYSVTQVLQGGVHRVNSWMNGQASTRFHMRDGKIEGWMDFASAALKGRRTCYRAGQTLEDTAYCQSAQAQLEQLSLREATPGHSRLSGTTTDQPEPRPAQKSSGTPTQPIAESQSVGQASPAEPAQADSSRDEMTMGDVIIYRSKRSLNADVDYLVSWQGKPQGVVRNGGVLKMRLPAGPQVLHFTNFRPGSYELQESLTVSAQTEAYFFMRLHLSLSARSQMSIEPVSVEKGRAAVMDSLN